MTENLFLDIDGVLIGKAAQANHAKEFLEFCMKRYDCYCLTTHCRGSVDTVIDYLNRSADDEFLSLAKRIKPTDYRTFKTEALHGDFLWIDDQPTAYELQVLEENGWLDRWLQVDTRKDPDGLKTLMEFLRR